MLVPNKNPQGYKEHVNYFIEFDFGEFVTIIDWIETWSYASNID